MTSEELATSKEQLIYLLLPRMVHEDFCRDWEACCSAKVNAELFVDLLSTMPGDGDDLVDAINAYVVDEAIVMTLQDLDERLSSGDL